MASKGTNRTLVVEYNAVEDVVDMLPDDAWLLVFKQLNIRDRLNIARVCKKWRFLAQTSWKSVTKLSFESLTLPWPPYENEVVFFMDKLLEYCLKQCGPQLQCLDLSSASSHRITSQALNLVSTHGHWLKDLHLFPITIGTDAFKKLAKGLPRLTSLNLYRTKDITEEGLQSALELLQSLQSLNIAGHHDLTGSFFIQAPQSLREAIMYGCYNLKDGAIEILTRRCPNLESINIGSCYRLTGQSIVLLTNNCPKLKVLAFYFHSESRNVQTAHFLTLSKLRHLKELRLDSHKAVTNDVCHALAKHCPSLQTLSFDECTSLTDVGIASLHPCSRLEYINLSWCAKITDDGLINLSANHPHLKWVYVSHCPKVSDRGVSCLLKQHPNVAKLDVSWCDNVTNDVLPHLMSSLDSRTCTKVLDFDVVGTSIDEEAASDFDYHPKCYLSYSRFTY